MGDNSYHLNQLIAHEIISFWKKYGGSHYYKNYSYSDENHDDQNTDERLKNGMHFD